MKSTLAAGLLVAALPASFVGYKSFFGCPLSACGGGESPAAVSVAAAPAPSDSCCSLKLADAPSACGEAPACAETPACAGEKTSATLASAEGAPCEFCD